MNKIVSTLLDSSNIMSLPKWIRNLFSDAADEIERLRKIEKAVIDQYTFLVGLPPDMSDPKSVVEFLSDR